MTQESITRNGIAGAGDHDVEWEGDTKSVYDEITLGDYDSANDGNGNLFDVLAVYGFSRLKIVHLEVVAAAYDAQYDHANNSVRVYNLSDGTEVGQGTTLGIDIRVNIRGQG